MNFSNKKVNRTFTSPHSQNAWGSISGHGWKKVKKKSDDGVTNMFVLLCAARANNRTVSGTIDSKDKITKLYL